MLCGRRKIIRKSDTLQLGGNIGNSEIGDRDNHVVSNLYWILTGIVKVGNKLIIVLPIR